MILPFKLTEDDRAGDPLLEVARPGRIDVAYDSVGSSHKLLLDSFRAQDTKASALTGWISAVMAISVLGQISSGKAHFPVIILVSFVCLIAALLFALAVHRPWTVKQGGMMDPLVIYEYQSQEAWDHRASKDYTADQIAEAQTKLKIIQCADVSIKSLAADIERKTRLLWTSHVFYVAGLL